MTTRHPSFIIYHSPFIIRSNHAPFKCSQKLQPASGSSRGDVPEYGDEPGRARPESHHGSESQGRAADHGKVDHARQEGYAAPPAPGHSGIGFDGRREAD